MAKPLFGQCFSVKLQWSYVKKERDNNVGRHTLKSQKEECKYVSMSMATVTVTVGMITAASVINVYLNIIL